MIIGNRKFHFDHQVYVMGILNVTPDSFSDGGAFLDPARALEQALRMQEEGADLIDIGAESTRPGADPVSADEELRRLLPVLRKMAPTLKVPISVDTQKSVVARSALEEGAAMINDISALEDAEMADVIARHGAPVILMHKKGTPKTMQENPSYEDVLEEVASFLQERVRFAQDRGIRGEKILIDPGFGFGKRLEDNLTLLRLLNELKVVHQPIAVGVSRKSFLRRFFGNDPASLMAGSVATALMMAERGAALLRVHDVGPTKAAIRLANPDQFP